MRFNGGIECSSFSEPVLGRAWRPC